MSRRQGRATSFVGWDLGELVGGSAVRRIMPGEERGEHVADRVPWWKKGAESAWRALVWWDCRA